MCKEVVEYVKAQNIAAKERMANDPSLHIGLWAEGAEHWAEYDTLEAWKRAMAIDSYFAVYKSWNGIKPRWETFTTIEGRDMTPKEIDEMTMALSTQENDLREELEAARLAKRIVRAKERGENKRKCYPRLGDNFPELAALLTS